LNLIPAKKCAPISPNLPVALISLPEDSDRRLVLRSRGVPESWLANFWPGVDLRCSQPEDLSQIADSERITAQIGRRVRPGELGCAAAHRSVATWLAKSEHQMALVLEDDIDFDKARFLDAVKSISDALIGHASSGSAFICHLGPPKKQITNLIKRRVVSQKHDSLSEKFGIFLHTDPINKIWRTHAYIISRSAAERQLALEPRIMTLADDWVARRDLGLIDEIFFITPALVKQDEETPSTIGERPSAPPESANLSRSSFATRVLESIRESRFLYRANASWNYRTASIKARLQSLTPYKIA